MKTFSFALLFAFACASAEKRNLRSLADVSVYGSKGDSGGICAISCGSGTVQIGNQCVVGASCQALWKDGEEPHYDPKHPCQCNSLCSVYSNCCLDYTLPENSCVSKGCPAHYKQEWQCQCNDLCAKFGNCCKDAHKCAVPTKGTLSPTTLPTNNPTKSPTYNPTDSPTKPPTNVQTAPSNKWGKWSKEGQSMVPGDLVVERTSSDGTYRLATGTVVVGGEDGVREGYFEVELTADASDFFYVGIVKTGLDHETHQSNNGNSIAPYNDAWYLDTYDGSLLGNDKNNEDEQGKLKEGDRVGVLVDLDGGEGGDGGSVRFFVNGSEYGPGFKSGVVGPVVLGVELGWAGQVVTLLPDAQKPAGL